jgi:hypothetical protein
MTHAPCDECAGFRLCQPRFGRRPGRDSDEGYGANVRPLFHRLPALRPSADAHYDLTHAPFDGRSQVRIITCCEGEQVVKIRTCCTREDDLHTRRCLAKTASISSWDAKRPLAASQRPRSMPSSSLGDARYGPSKPASISRATSASSARAGSGQVSIR